MSHLLQKEMNQKHCNAKTSTLNGSALSTKCRKYEKVISDFFNFFVEFCFFLRNFDEFFPDFAPNSRKE